MAKAISIIIPLLNEETWLKEHVGYFRDLKHCAELIFVDGGSTDMSSACAQNYGRVVNAPTGRGVQKNTGALSASTDHLLFMHIDTCIAPQTVEHITRILAGDCDAGCLQMTIDGRGIMYRMFERVINWRARMWGVLDGDLGLFITRDLFNRVGGFDAVCVMEDIMFGKKLKHYAHVRVLNEPIFVSPRTWQDNGFLRTWLRYTTAWVRYWLGLIAPVH